MSFAILKCGQCQKEYITGNDLCADTCGHQKCRECIQNSSCKQCTNKSDEQTKSMIEKIEQKPKKESKISSQTHIVEELSSEGAIQYHCTACGKTFRSRSQKYYHLQCNQSNETVYKCDICNKVVWHRKFTKYFVKNIQFLFRLLVGIHNINTIENLMHHQ